MAKKKNQKEEVLVDVQEVYSKSEQFVERNKKILSILIGALALAFLLFFAYRFFIVKPNEEAASAELYKSEMYFLQDSLNLALVGDDFAMGSEEVANEYSNTKAGQLAAYMSAIAYRDAGDYESALELFKKCDFDDAVVGTIAMGNVGDMYIETGDVENGAKWLEDAGKKGRSTMAEDFSTPLYLFKSAQAYMEIENYSKAKELLTIVVEDYPQFRNKDLAIKFLGSLNNK